MASSENKSYCVLCQEDHTMNDQCVILHALCKGCGKTGHLRKDCPEPVDPSCARDAGEELQESYRSSSSKTKSASMSPDYAIDKSECLNTAMIVSCNESLALTPDMSEEIINSAAVDPNTLSSLISQSLILDSNPKVHIPVVKHSNSSYRVIRDYRTPSDITDAAPLSKKRSREEILESANNNSLLRKSKRQKQTSTISFCKSPGRTLVVKVVLDTGTAEITDEIKPTCVFRLSEKSYNFESTKLDKECSYTVVSIHIECFRSSNHSSTKLTQVGCTTHGPDADNFFASIKPAGIEDYLDNYKVGGDLLQALHMTREDDGVFLFRSKFEAIVESAKRVCVEENEALDKLLQFLQKYPNCIIVGVDEETVAVLVEKLQKRDEKKAKTIVGFTYWKRVLKHLDVDGYKNIDLEEYHAKLIGETLPTFNTALDIAKVLMNSIREVSTLQKGGRKGLDAGFYKLCKRIRFLNHPRKPQSDEGRIENIMVYSSFRPSVSISFSAEKLEQIVVSSESESELEVE